MFLDGCLCTLQSRLDTLGGLPLDVLPRGSPTTAARINGAARCLTTRLEQYWGLNIPAEFWRLSSPQSSLQMPATSLPCSRDEDILVPGAWRENWLPLGKVIEARGTPASREQGRLVAGICSELCGELSLQNSAGMFKPQYCSSRVVKHRAALLMRAAVVRLPLGSTSRGSPPNVSSDYNVHVHIN
jgi:hypothetical protein